MNILVFKLKNGVDVISEVDLDKTTKDAYHLVNPYQIVPLDSFDDEGIPIGTIIILNQWLMFAKEQTVLISKKDILISYTPNKFLLTMYLSRKLEDEENPPRTGFSTKGKRKKNRPYSGTDGVFRGMDDRNSDDESEDNFNDFEDRGDDPFF